MKRPFLLIALLAVIVGAAAPGPHGADLHFALSKSVPAAEAAVTSPEKVRLWFTEAPQDHTMRVRLVDSSDHLVETGEATPDADDGSIFSVAIPDALDPGSYTVAWRAMGDDGHVVRGDFVFSVALP